MKVGIIYDTINDYIDDKKSTIYTDYITVGEVDYISDQLKLSNHNIEIIGSPSSFFDQITNQSFDCDIIFNLAEGFNSRNREGYVPSICEFLNIPYVGTDAYGLSLTLHKHHTKLLLNDIGITIPKGFIYDYKIHDFSELKCLMKNKNLTFPIVLKPNREGTSMGLKIAKNIFELKAKLINLIETFNQEILCEEYIDGLELAVPMITVDEVDKALGIVHYSYESSEEYPLYSAFYKEKGNHNTSYIQLKPEINDKIISDALKIKKFLQCKDISRIDFKLHNDIPYFLEMTPSPGGLGFNGTFEKGAQLNGYTYAELLNQIITSSLKRQE